MDMALCDRLENALTTAHITRLLEVLVHEALERVATLATEAAE